MQEHCDDAYWAHEAHCEEVNAPYVARHGAAVGELAVYESARNNPSQQYTSEESAERHE